MFSMEKGEEFLAATGTGEGYKEQLDRYAPGASEFVTGGIFGGTYQRDRLELRDRQMLTMSALAAMGGCEPQLEGHILTAINQAGMSKEDVAECFVHLMPYIGVPKTLAAFRCMYRALGEA